MGGMKGILTLSVLLLASALLLLVASISLYTNSLQSTNVPLSNLERVNAQFDSPAYWTRNILLIEAVNVTKQGNNILFEENLTVSGTYVSDISRFKEFIENNTLLGRNDINVTLDITEAQMPKMYIMPQEIEVDHPSDNQVTFTPQNTVQSAGDVNGYVLYIVVNQDVPRIRWPDNLSEVPSSDPNALYFEINVQGNNQFRSDTRYLDKYQLSIAEIDGAATQPSVTIEIDSPAKMDLTYNSGNKVSEYTNMSLNTTIQLNSSASVELGRNIINVSQRHEIENLGPVMILEG